MVHRISSTKVFGAAVIVAAAQLVVAQNAFAGVSLFGVDLEKAACPQLFTAIKARGAETLATPAQGSSGVDFEALLFGSGRSGSPVNRGRRGTVFASGKLLEGTDELEIRCLKDGRIVSATYRFLSFVDLGHVDEIRALVEAKYGAPKEARGRAQSPGEVAYLWQAGEVRIRVFRGWPATSTFLKYSLPTRVREYREETQTIDEQTTKHKAKEQGDAF